MAYAEKYNFKFKSDNGQVFTIKISQDGFHGDIIKRNLGDSPVLRMESSDNGCIHGSSLEFKVETLIDGEFADLYTSSPRLFKVQLLADEDSIWQGFVTPELYSEPDIAPPYDVTITATDQLGELRNFYWPSRLMSTPMTWLQAISLMLYNTGLGLSIATNSTISNSTVSTSGVDATLQNTYIDFEWAYEEGRTMYDMLSQMMATMHASIRQYNGYWYIARETDVAVAGDKLSGSFLITSPNHEVEVPVIHYGSAENHSVFPVGSLYMEIIPSTKNVTVKAPNHYRTIINGINTVEQSTWAKNSQASWNSEMNGFVLAQNGQIDNSIILDGGAPGAYKLTLNVRNLDGSYTMDINSQPVSVRVRAIDSNGNYHYAAQLSSSTSQYRRTVAAGQPLRGGVYREATVARSDAALFGSVESWNQFDVPAPTSFDEGDLIQIEIIVPFPYNSGNHPGRVGFHITQANVTIKNTGTRGSMLVEDCWLEPYYQLEGWESVADCANSAREEGDEIELLFSHTTVTSKNVDKYLPSMPHNNGAITSWSSAQFSNVSYLSLITADYAISCCLPRERKTGKLNVPVGSKKIPFVLIDDYSGTKYTVKTLSWDLLHDDWDVELESVPELSMPPYLTMREDRGKTDIEKLGERVTELENRLSTILHK